MEPKIDSLPIIYRDAHFVAVNKPPGIHVHPTPLSPREDSCMKILRDQLGQWVYPIHRLDRATSGVLLFGLNKEAAGAMIELFAARAVIKRYLAVVRGFLNPTGVIERPLRETKTDPYVEAITRYRCLGKVELPIPVGLFPTARYSLVRVFPETGRKNQVRKHFAGISHPIVGDVQFGDGRHNRIFRMHFNISRLLLFATELAFAHPFSGEAVVIKAPLSDDIMSLFARPGWQDALKNELMDQP